MTRVSIITVSFNSAKTIERTLASVRSQTHPDIEHVVVDGGSLDGTREIIERNSSSIGSWVSETDRGLYHAMNKGWQMASGDVIGFLNSDDTLKAHDTVAAIAKQFERTGADAVYSDLELVGQSGKVVRRWQSGTFHRLKYHLGWMTPHPTTYVRRVFFERFGGFREDLSISADYELMLRFFYRHRANVQYLPQTTVQMMAGGVSNSSIRSVLRANWQVYNSWRLNSLVTSPTLIVTKPLSKLAQLRF